MPTISEAYRKQNEQAHVAPGWGTTGHRFAGLINNLYLVTHSDSILDYGAGKQTLKRAILDINPKARVFCYDPCIPEISKSPGKHDLVTCTDVFEHVEPDHLDDFLDDIARVMRNTGFFTISTVPAIKKLPDGRNAHLIVEDYRWWLPKIWERFNITVYQNLGTEFSVIVDKI